MAIKLASVIVRTTIQTLDAVLLHRRSQELVVHYLYGSKKDELRRLVATFDSEAQLLAYVRWATLGHTAGGSKFEQGSALAGYSTWEFSTEPLTEDDEASVLHNPTPSML